MCLNIYFTHFKVLKKFLVIFTGAEGAGENFLSMGAAENLYEGLVGATRCLMGCRGDGPPDTPMNGDNGDTRGLMKKYPR